MRGVTEKGYDCLYPLLSGVLLSLNKHLHLTEKYRHAARHVPHANANANAAPAHDDGHAASRMFSSPPFFSYFQFTLF